MTDKPVIGPENVEILKETPFLSLYDLQYAEGRHYFDASRKRKEDLAAIKSDEAVREKTADAVNLVVIVKTPGAEPKLLLSYEYRYPTGQILLSPPAGMLDPEDGEGEAALFAAAKRELKEETGIGFRDTDRIFVINPLVWSSPGMTDECNALVGISLEREDLSELNQTGAVGTELFYGFELLGKEEARTVLRAGRDRNGMYYSVFTWCALMSFVSGLTEL